jgi:recombinational DNA repair ATPase RecF
MLSGGGFVGSYTAGQTNMLQAAVLLFLSKGHLSAQNQLIKGHNCTVMI